MENGTNYIIVQLESALMCTDNYKLLISIENYS